MLIIIYNTCSMRQVIQNIVAGLILFFTMPTSFASEVTLVDFNAKAGEFKEYAVSGPTKASVKVGKDILAAGGNAIDAVIAMQAAINLTEMHASGFGGGGYITYFSAKTGKIVVYDGREAAPAKATRNSTFGQDSKDELQYRDDYLGGQYIAVPGILHAMKKAHNEHGNMMWNKLFSPTIDMANKGFQLEPRLLSFYTKYKNVIPDVQKVLEYDPVTKTAKSTELARMLSDLSGNTVIDDFYSGKIGNDIVRIINQDNSTLSMGDLKGYNSSKNDPMCIPYKGYKICTRKDAFFVFIAMKLLESIPLHHYKADDPTLINYIANAVNVALAYKRQYQEDGFKNVEKPLSLIGNTKNNLENCQVYEAAKVLNTKQANRDNTTSGTTSFFAIDKHGNIAVVGSSINGYFGAGIAVNGMFLNNTMFDFANCENCINKVKPRARPASSIMPIIVLDDKNRPVFGLTSAGGIRIVSYVVSALVNMLDLGLDPQESINAIKYSVHNNCTIMFEPGRISNFIKNPLEKRGHKVIESAEVISGLVAFNIKYDSNSLQKNIIVGREIRRQGAFEGK